MSSQLRAKREALAQLWEQGLHGNSLLRKQSDTADEFIRDCFSSAPIEDMGSWCSLVALGGYGRQEQYPFSDIDIMILFKPEMSEKVGEVANAIFYPLWDTGLEVGHGVRTVKESMEHAAEDFFFRVALIDCRFLAGSKELFDELQQSYRSQFVDGKRHEFVKIMHQYRNERREKYGSHSFLLEPHIKEGKGGLRDIQAMMWTSKVVFGLSGLREIAGAGLLTASELTAFEQSWDMLVKLRNRLHYLSKRKNDQLYFEEQEAMAESFGHSSSSAGLAVEGFMREVYSHLQRVAAVTDLFFDHVDEVLSIVGENSDRSVHKVIEQGIEIRGNRIHLAASQSELQAKPHLLMRLFLASARTGVLLHHRTYRLVSQNLELITDKVQNSPRMSKPFFSIFTEAKDLFYVLETMLETGLLQSYIPEFAKIESLAQHDLYHIYTVDRHSLQAMAELKQVIVNEPDTASHVGSMKVLFLAALLHDIGKGSGQDHSEYGAIVATKIGQRLGLTEDENVLLAFLVQYHLFIPENALRRDLDDASFIRGCAEELQSKEKLAMLYLLSIADSKATGPSAWSDWKASLMHDMYLKVGSHYDDIGVLNTDSLPKEHVEQNTEWLRERVVDALADEQDVRIDPESISKDYLLAFPPEVVAEHLLIHRDNHRIVRQKALLRAKEETGCWSVLVLSKDQPGLLAKICGVLSLHNLNVLNVQVFAWQDNTAVGAIDVLPIDGLQFKERDWQAMGHDLDLAISGRLALTQKLYQKLSNTYGRQVELAGALEPQVMIDNTVSDQYTVIEVHARDLPGQLYYITQTLADFGLSIHKTFVATEVEQLIDVFYVSNSEGKKITDSALQEEIREGLLYAVTKLVKKK